MICFNTYIDLSLANADFNKSMLIGQDFSVMKWMLESGLHHSLLLLTGVRSSFFRHTRDRTPARGLFSPRLYFTSVSNFRYRRRSLCSRAGASAMFFFKDLFNW